MKIPRSGIFSIALVTAGILAACGGGGGSGGGETIVGLQMPTKLSVVTAQSDDTPRVSGLRMDYGAIAGALASNTTLGAFPADADYNTDPSNTWVYDPSIQSLSIVNEILCMMDQTKATEMVNQGAYVALVNEEKCMEGQNQSQASSGGAQSTSGSAQTTSYKRWVIESERSSNGAPQEVRIWIPGEANADHPMDGQNMVVEVTVDEGVSAQRPFGSFVLNFKGVVDGALIDPQLSGQEVTTMRGTLKTVARDDGKPQFQFIDQAGAAMGGQYASLDFSMVEKSNVILDDASGSAGVARTYFEESWPGEGERKGGFNVAFNENLFLRGEDTNGDDSIDHQACTSRNDFTRQTWRYNLYHLAGGTFNGRTVTAGERVKLNSGFPFEYTDGAGTHYGHIGYWGIWTEDNLPLTQLANKSIRKQTFGDGGTAESYRVNVSSGKLWKRSRVASSYARMVGVELNWWGDPDDAGPLPQGDYRATVVDTGASYALKVTGTLTWTEGGSRVEAIDPVDITPASEWEQQWLYSDMLGGSVVFRPLTADDQVVFFKEEVLSPGESVPTTLWCYERCLKGGLGTAITPSSEEEMYHIQWNDGQQPPVTYTVESSNGALTLNDHEGRAVVIPDGLDLSGFGNWYQWGAQTGEMVTQAVAEPWQVYDAEVTYRWETGPNAWNRQVSVTNASSQVVNFDKPLQFAYEYAEGDDPNGDRFAAGTPFRLEYGGPGQLWGFPFEKEDPTCDEATGHCRWISRLTLKRGVQLGDYVVRPVESEQTMVEQADTSSCAAAGLSVTSFSLALPGAVDAQVTLTWAERPEVTTAPAVIEGELQ